MTTLNAQPRKVWHVGFVVDDVDETMAELTAGLGLSWIEHHSDTDVEAPGGVSYHIKSKIAFSTNLPCAIELLQVNPGTPNVRQGDTAFHHFGYWSDNLEEEDERLTELGYPCIYYRNDPDNGLRRIALNEGPAGVIIESCNVNTDRAGLEQFYPEVEGDGQAKIWHIAFAVDKLEPAIEEFSKVLGLGEWTPIKHFVGDALDADGKPYRIDTRLTFATDGPVAIELFETVPDTPNAPAKGTSFHHLGIWGGSIPEEKARLEEAGWFLTGGDTSEESRAAFFSSKLGIWFEACNVNAQRKGLEKYYPATSTLTD